MRLLVADDDPVSRTAVRAALASSGYEISVTGDGAEALEILLGPDPPRIAVLDWQMPGLRGPEICRAVRERGGERYTYLMLLTVRAERADLLCGLESGADDFVRKPFDPAELLFRLRTARRILEVQDELIRARDALHEQAVRDSLTGLYNRRAALDRVAEELARLNRSPRRSALAMFDLDDLKAVNDTHGHAAGDAVLREVSQRVLARIRPYDVLARIGGDEFLLLLPDCASPQAVVERVRAVVSDSPVAWEGSTLPATISLGAAVTESSLRLEDWVEAADAALYRAKRAGRNRVDVSSVGQPREIDPAPLGVRREMVRAFLDCGPEQLAAFQAAVAQGRSDKIVWAAHSLRGSVSFFRKGEVVDLLATIEQAGRREDVQVARGCAPAVLDAVRQLLSELQAEDQAASMTTGSPTRTTPPDSTRQ